MKKQIAITLIAIAILTSALFIDIGNAATQATTTIQSSGTISQPTANPVSLTVILRSICITSLNPNQIDINTWVDNYVINHSSVTAITISDMHQYGIWWYGYSFSQTNGTWMGWTFQQLETLINRFHYHGWKVGLETTAIAWVGQQEYNYIVNQHPELAFTNANGVSAATINKGTNKIIPDFFATFTTPDTTNNIPVGTRLIDLYTTRLTQMIKDGLQWDFWFGTDGWNGVSNQGYYWNTQTANQCYSFSAQEENDFGNWTGAILPSGWASMSQTQKASAIIGNSNILNNWWYYWQIRFAQMYAQIKQAFINAGESAITFHLIGTADTSSGPSNPGGLCAAGMYNMTLLAQYSAVDYFYVDQESATPSSNLGQDEAYAGALVKMQNPLLNPIIGLQPQDWKGGNYTVWQVEESYLAQAVNYVWYNGEQYRVSSPNVIMMQYGFSNWTQQEISSFFSYIQSIANILANAQPDWLGPVYATPSSISAMGNAWYQMNYNIAQWAWTANLQNNPQYISSAMGTILMDEALQDTGPNLQGLNNVMINSWGSNNLNLWYWENSGRDWGMSSVWAPPATASVPTIESQISSAFHITRSYGSTTTYTISSQLNDAISQQIASNYAGTAYSLSGSEYYVHGVYVPTTGFVTIASFTNDNPNRIAVGYYKNATSSNFLLTHIANALPKSMVNEMLYWVCNCPVNSSEPLIDLKVLNYGGTIIIPITNQRDPGGSITSTLNINATALGLGNPLNYHIYWASSGITVPFTDWSNISVTLNGVTDVLVISPS